MIVNGAVTRFWMFENFEVVVSANVVLHQYRWASFLVMYLRVGISREDVFAILINRGFERFCSPIPYFGRFHLFAPFGHCQFSFPVWRVGYNNTLLNRHLKRLKWKQNERNVMMCEMSNICKVGMSQRLEVRFPLGVAPRW